MNDTEQGPALETPPAVPLRWQCCHCGGGGLDSYGETCRHCNGLGLC
ncbi:hypothetical protein Pth03_46970 [Planotetraspora thailandica]|uniref:Uncharacterized protein n=1 Tax=Planotetraspora thailandica TaxID=487172 RepID=A0A8J3V2L2_9ACTN|nr:hypothetical protein [Planotetraspora thailandica]GII56308.1 hypothetical protein Pth03_46970 [Planotetraspora thailandica]